MIRSPTPIVSKRSGRKIRLPARYTDFLPLSDAEPPAIERPTCAVDSQDQHRSGSDHSARSEWRTDPNEMGLFRVYPSEPTLIPADTGLVSVTDAPTLQQPLPRIVPSTGLVDSEPRVMKGELFSAFSSPTAGLLMCWHYLGSNVKSAAEPNRLATNFTGDPLFANRTDSANFSYEREKKLVDKYLQSHSNPFRAEHGWMKSSVKIRLPKEKVHWSSEMDPAVPELEVKGVYHRSLTDIIKAVFEGENGHTFHMTPFRQQWTTADNRTVNIYSEIYSSPALLDAHAEINALRRIPGDDLERVVAPLMMWSDSTHLANFGDASLWPFYLFFGNQSKYTRGKPTASACHHVAYIPTVHFLVYSTL